ncbi:hypothetical protein [Heyndrickxia camelliae]|uniref:Uncharacterized protein n=1 Tax=Heyndrickxia camelliae TaxID=1707093 RepID=A0A2N3LJT3_9BACI|nr:hypothetical protein [Heyndrickxia camelliae]PKR84888.1 hypothetical protein CWO92_10970 [Heyndrickxia camelliae]
MSKKEEYQKCLNETGKVVQLIEKYEGLKLYRFAELYRGVLKSQINRLKELKRAVSAPTPTA